MKASVFAFILAENVGNQLRRLLHVWRAAADLLSNWLLGVFEVQAATPTHFGTTASIDQTRFEPNPEAADVVEPQKNAADARSAPPRCERLLGNSSSGDKYLPSRVIKFPLFYSPVSCCFGTFRLSSCDKCQYALIKPQIGGVNLGR